LDLKQSSRLLVDIFFAILNISTAFPSKLPSSSRPETLPRIRITVHMSDLAHTATSFAARDITDSCIIQEIRVGLDQLSDIEIIGLVTCVVHNLQEAPDPSNRELSDLPTALKNPAVDTIPRRLASQLHLPNILPLCMVHEGVSPLLLDELDSLLRRVVVDILEGLVLTQWPEAFVMMGGVYDDNVADLFLPYQYEEVALHQQNNCAGCRARRILSDPKLLEGLALSTNLLDGVLKKVVVCAWRRSREVAGEMCGVDCGEKLEFLAKSTEIGALSQG